VWLAFALAKAAVTRDDRVREDVMIATIVRFKMPRGEAMMWRLARSFTPSRYIIRLALRSSASRSASMQLDVKAAASISGRTAPRPKPFLQSPTAFFKVHAGQVNEIEYRETHVVVDNSTSEVIFA